MQNQQQSTAPQPSKLHFPREDYEARQRAVVAEMRLRGLDGLLIFKQESMYYLTGYDTMGYITFQAMLLTAQGDVALLTREPDRRAAMMTSLVDDVRIYDDRPDVDPSAEFRELVRKYNAKPARLGIEYDAFGLTSKRCKMVEASFTGFAALVDASDLVNELRLIKSPAEITYIRKAAELADTALEAAFELARPGVSEGELFAAMQSVIFRNGGDYTASRWILGVGQHALLVRHFTGHHNVIEQRDQIQLEYGAAYLHYHACLFHTLYVGQTHARQVEMRKTAIEALEGAKKVCKPGVAVGDMFEAYAGVCDNAGYRDCRLNACGYSVGATYPPTWMDGMLIMRGNEKLLQPGMVLFPHMVLLDEERGMTGCAGETLLVTEDGCEGLSRIPHELYRF